MHIKQYANIAAYCLPENKLAACMYRQLLHCRFHSDKILMQFLDVGRKNKLAACMYRQLLHCRFHSDKILMHFLDVGRKPPTFADAGMIANEIVNCGYEFENCELYYNVFR